MTDPTGRSFLSYRRSRFNEAELLIAAQHELGIPTWQDISDLDEEPTEASIRDVLLNPLTANAVMWLTPDVANSAFIQRVEAPCIMKRHAQNDGFFVIPVAAGGLSYADAASVAGGYLGIRDLQGWNLVRFDADPITTEEAQQLAARVLKRRLSQVHTTLPSKAPIQIVFNTRQPASGASAAITVDWSHRFDGRRATKESWYRHLLPALEALARTIILEAPGRRVVVRGFASISAATALGCIFLAPRGLPVSWSQYTLGRPDQLWSTEVTRTSCGFETEIVEASINADDLAVLLSVACDVEAAFTRTRPDLPPFRAILQVKPSTGSRYDLADPGQVSDVAHVVVEEIRKMRSVLQPRGQVHLFMAVPVGLAMMVGQLLNTLGPVQLYEHDPVDAVGLYYPSVLIHPSLPHSPKAG